MTEPKRIVLAYSGGLDTSVIMRWLQETYRCPVVAFVADLGQDEDLDAIARKAQQTGAEQVLRRGRARCFRKRLSCFPRCEPMRCTRAPICWERRLPGR